MVSDSNDLGQLLLTRHDVLRALARDSHTKRELVEEQDIRRSTISSASLTTPNLSSTPAVGGLRQSLASA